MCVIISKLGQGGLTRKAAGRFYRLQSPGFISPEIHRWSPAPHAPTGSRLYDNRFLMSSRSETLAELLLKLAGHCEAFRHEPIKVPDKNKSEDEIEQFLKDIHGKGCQE